MSRIIIPGLVDIMRVDEATKVADVANDVRFDRRYIKRGPILNRIILGRVRSTLALDGVPLPPVAERGQLRPLATQTATAECLDMVVAAGISGPDIDALAAYVQGEGEKSRVGVLAQQVVGRLFDAAYRADAQSWAAALVMRDAPSSFNPVKRLLWAISGRIAKARSLLASKVNDDPTGVHATGVAIHNLVSGFTKMRSLYADTGARARQSTEAAVAASLVAPDQVLRQPVKAGICPAGAFSENTLVLLQLQKANASDPGYDTAFMVGSWSECPAHRWVPALLGAVWQGAIGAAN